MLAAEGGGGQADAGGEGAADAPGGPDASREAGNKLMRAGDHAGAAAHYEDALGQLRQERAAGERLAPVLGNLSAAQLALGRPAAALSSAEGSAAADESYAKAYFRQAKALLALGRPHEAANRARLLLLVSGDPAASAGARPARAAERAVAPPDVCILLQEAQVAARARLTAAAARAAACAPTASAAASNAPADASTSCSALDAAPEVPELVARFCGGGALARLSRCSGRLRAMVDRSELLRARAAELCPGGSAGWLRVDLLGTAAGPGGRWAWLYALRRAAHGAAVRDRLAVCGGDLSVRVCEPLPGGGEVQPLATQVPCLPFTLCWGPQGEYLAYTAIQGRTRPSLVLALPPGRNEKAIVTPLRPGLMPYYLSPSPCGTRVALLGNLGGRQGLLVADASQVVAPDRELAPPVSLRALGSAAPLYFDWAPHGPDMLLASRVRELTQVRAEVASEALGLDEALEQRPREPSLDGSVPELPAPALTIRGGPLSWRAPQWLPASPGRPRGRWLVPRDGEGGGGRVSLALVDPATMEAEVVCEHLPPDVHFAASSTCRWVAWSGLHDAQGHGGVFARRLLPAKGPPVMVFNGAAEALSWGGDRLALLLREPGGTGRLVWAVWDPPGEEAAEGGDRAMLTVAPQAFEPSHHVAERVLPFFDQFERRMRVWSPRSDAVALADSGGHVWVQPFPPAAPGGGDGAPGGGQPGQHPFSLLVGAADSTRSAPPPFCVGEGIFVCWSPC